MQRKILILFFLLLLIFFGLASRAIVDVKLQELRFQLTKEQLLNYELSSKVLKDKIRQMMLSKDDYTNEIKVNILESSVMNAQLGETDTKLSLLEKFGLGIVNVVRVISTKSPLTLEEDQNDMMKIQFGFYMERTRKFATAVKKYQELEKSLTNKESDEYGFVMLHSGFCIAMMGDTKGAIAKLRETEDLFVGSHFADNARILINVLLEGERKLNDINSGTKTETERAALLYETGQYKETLSQLEKIENRSNDQNYMRARSLEELGQTSKAIAEYLSLVEKKEIDKEIAKKANRRLLLIGSIYEKNEDLTDYSKSNAQKLGDTDIVKKVDEGSALILNSNIVEKLTNDSQTNADPEVAQEFQELKKELETIKLKETEERKESTEKVEKEVAVIRKDPVVEEEKFDSPYNLTMKLTLSDGRSILGKTIVFEEAKINVTLDTFSSKLPATLLSEIVVNNNPNLKNPPIQIELKNGKTSYGFKIVRDSDESFKLKNKSSETSIDEDSIQRILIR
ncbi:MAG: hypothetical protein KBF93_13030 [Leptospiraceae bacterium]|nr:hypothetical protein [Leptospiraceae bacterium]